MQGHLLIGPPSSGKSTLAKIMAPILKAEIISTDFIREKIYGNENIQGEWSEIKLEVQNQIINCLRNKKIFIIDATHAKRPWRLSITQNLNLNYEIEWFGWWLKTPKLKCFEWNKLRPRKVPEKIIGDYYSPFKIKKLLSFEIPSSTDWGINSNNKIFNPNYFVDISKYFKKKELLLNQYKFEMRKTPHSRSIKNINALSIVRGGVVGFHKAEGFFINRIIE